LRKAGLLESTRRGFYKVTQIGLETLSQKPSKVDTKYLQRFLPFQEFIRAKSDKTSEEDEEITTAYSKSPEESLEYSYQRLREVLTGDLLIQIKNSSPDFFERLVVELLVRMGYGGSIKEAGKAIGRSGDEGIDGTIKEDVLGLDIIYIQAKKWDGAVGRPEIQKFAGALQGQRARKGFLLQQDLFQEMHLNFHLGLTARLCL
jgi:restriction system protein